MSSSPIAIFLYFLRIVLFFQPIRFDYEGVSWSEIADKGDHWAVSHTYRANAKVIQKQLFRFQNPDGPVYCKILSVQDYQ